MRYVQIVYTCISHSALVLDHGGYLCEIDSVAEMLHKRIFAPRQSVLWDTCKMSICDAAHRKGDFVAVDFRRYR